MRPYARFTCLLCAALGLVVGLSGGSTRSAQAVGLGAASGSYEEPPVLRAADRLPAGLLSGPHHTVEAEVGTDGFMS